MVSAARVIRDAGCGVWSWKAPSRCDERRRLATPPPPPPSVTGTFGPLCGAVEVGEYYWSSLERSIEACSDEDAGAKSWTTGGLVAGVLLIAGVIGAFKTKLDSMLTKRCGRWWTTPAGVISFTFANGRAKVLW